VGSTIYPGMQFVSVWIKRYLLTDWSLNDICCYVPAWFGVIASFMTGLIAYECSARANSSAWTFLVDLVLGQRTESMYPTPVAPAVLAGVFTMAIMAIVPAHLMRSVGGGYDNESVAVTAMVTTFYCWVRSLRQGDPYSHWWGLVTALSYFGMVAAWGML
jgi:dolichyl-diphosphooligosaccharide--protein glycosyltransferase